MPDRFVAVDTTKYSDYYRDIVAKGLLNQYCVNYIDENRKALRKKYRTEDSFVEQFTVTPEMLDGLRALGEKEGVKFNQEQYDRSLPVIQTIMKALIGRDLFTQSTDFRMRPKQYCDFGGRPLLMTSVERVREAMPGARIVLVLARDWVEAWNEMCVEHGFDSPEIVVGGPPAGSRSGTP